MQCFVVTSYLFVVLLVVIFYVLYFLDMVCDRVAFPLLSLSEIPGNRYVRLFYPFVYLSSSQLYLGNVELELLSLFEQFMF